MKRIKNFSDSKVCYCCGVKEPLKIKKGCRKIIELHHITHQADGGSDEASNRVYVCGTCHSKIHLGLIILDKYYDTGGLWKLIWTDENGKRWFGPFRKLIHDDKL